MFGPLGAKLLVAVSSKGPCCSRKALSLLEVILALVILAGAMAVLGQVSFIGLRNAREARDMTQAELLCESKMAEITAGIVPCDPVSEAYFDSQFDPGSNASNDPDSTAWLYSIETELIDDTGLLAVRVTVVQDRPPARRPVELSIIRWMVDPQLEASEEDGFDDGFDSSTGGGR